MPGPILAGIRTFLFNNFDTIVVRSLPSPIKVFLISRSPSLSALHLQVERCSSKAPPAESLGQWITSYACTRTQGWSCQCGVGKITMLRVEQEQITQYLPPSLIPLPEVTQEGCPKPHEPTCQINATRIPSVVIPNAISCLQSLEEISGTVRIADSPMHGAWEIAQS